MVNLNVSKEECKLLTIKLKRLNRLRNKLKSHQLKEPMCKDFHSKCGFESAFILWNRISVEILSEIFSIEDSM